jgi:regulator of sigma E protease
MFTAIVTFIIVLSLLVLVHEWGHFYAAIRSGVKVEEFGFGFPPRVGKGFRSAKSGIIYSLNWIPLGGFVRLKGESGDSKDPDSFASQNGRKRALILGAGVMMNLAFAWFLLTIGFAIGVPSVLDEEALPPYAVTSQEKLQVVSVLADSPAASAGFRPGDQVLAVDGEEVGTVSAFSGHAAAYTDAVMQVEVRREGQDLTIPVTPALLQETGSPGIGVGLVRTGILRYPVMIAPFYGLVQTYEYTKEILLAFGGIIGELLTGSKPSVELSGPVGIAVVTGEVARLGIRYLIQFTALLSVNLAIINVLPIPALDGGRLAFLLVEKLRGRAVNARIEAAAHNLGFALLMLLVLVVTYGDIVRFSDRIMSAFANVFQG